MSMESELRNLSQFLIQTTDADGVIMVVLAGPEGPYYSAQLNVRTPTMALRKAIDCLHELADAIAKDVDARMAS